MNNINKLLFILFQSIYYYYNIISEKLVDSQEIMNYLNTTSLNMYHKS